MRKLASVLLISGPTLFASAAVHAAEALSSLQGAWAEASLDCASLFKTEDGKVTFRSLDGFNSGAFIVGDNKVRGQSTSCEIQRVREDGQEIVLLLACGRQRDGFDPGRPSQGPS